MAFFNINWQKARKVIVGEFIAKINAEFAAILSTLQNRLDASKAITKNPSKWIEDVKKNLRYYAIDNEIADMITAAIGVFDIGNDGTDTEAQKNIIWKALILNYGSGHLMQKVNDFFGEYERGGDYNANRKNASPPLAIVTRHDTYYDPDIDSYVPADSRYKPDRTFPQFAHEGSLWWSDIYEKLLQEDTRLQAMLDSMIENISEQIDYDWLEVNGCLEFNL